MFEDERATRVAKFLTLDEDCRDTERHDDRAEARHSAASQRSGVDVQKLRGEASEAREREDNTLLDSMIYAQSQLQASVLKAFGSQAAAEE